MTYQEAMEFIKASNQYGSVLGLESITELLNRLNNPQDNLRIVHVAGTNGKGSTSAFITNILAAEGYKVGRYSSPAVFSYREQIQIITSKDQQYDKNITSLKNTVTEITINDITEEGISDAITEIEPLCRKMVEDGFSHPTSFEIETAMAFLYFVKQKVDFAVVEVGLGGRLDATNAIRHPICSVITSISMDHMQFLGNTIEKITEEKAGIIKPGVPVVTNNNRVEVLSVLEKVCASRESQLSLALQEELCDIHYSPEETTFLYHGKNYRIQLLGNYQTSNAILAIQTAEILRRNGVPVSDMAIREGLFHTKWKGRFEIIAKKPYIILDGAHNEDAALQLRNALQTYFPDKKFIFIIGVLADKEYRKILQIMLPLAKIIITVTPMNQRALPSSKLAIESKAYGAERIFDADAVDHAARLALQEAKADDVILAFGSLSYLGELQEAIVSSSSPFLRPDQVD